MNDGRLNVSAGLAAYIRTVVHNEYLIHAKKDEIPMYAMYAYNIVKSDNDDASNVVVDGTTLDTYLNELKEKLTQYSSDRLYYVTENYVSAKLADKLDISDYELDKKNDSETYKTINTKITTLSENMDNNFSIVDGRLTNLEKYQEDDKSEIDNKVSIDKFLDYQQAINQDLDKKVDKTEYEKQNDYIIDQILGNDVDITNLQTEMGVKQDAIDSIYEIIDTNKKKIEDLEDAINTINTNLNTLFEKFRAYNEYYEKTLEDHNKRLQKLEGTYEEDVAEGGDLATQ